MFEANKELLRNIYKKTGNRRVAFCALPSISYFGDLGDFTISDKPVDLWIPQIAKNYESLMKFHAALQDDSVPYINISTGTHIYAAAFGAKIHLPPDERPCAVPFIESAAQAQTITVPDIWKSPTIYRIFEMTDRIIRQFGNEVEIVCPDMQTGFDIMSIFWNKQDLLISMIDTPEIVKNTAAKCTMFLKQFIREYKKQFPSWLPCHCPFVWSPPEMGPWFSNDECGCVTTQMFEEFMLPELIELSHEFGGIGMHCCADAEHQFESFKKIPNWYGFNRVAAKQGFTPLIKHFSGQSGPVMVIGWMGDVEEIRELLSASPAAMKYIFQCNFETLEDARMWLQACRSF